ncbi:MULTISPECIES: DUF3021 family protein [Staphylococcaceae]|uniref:DUF3021 family protein n=1 Tax=Staphylococcaceae TaxID=90964 RepID=UPI0039C98FD1
MNLYKKGIYRGGIIFSILFLFYLFMKIIGFPHNINFLFYSFIGLILGCFSVIYDVKKWTLKKQVIIHFIIMCFTIFPIQFTFDYIINGNIHYLENISKFLKIGLIIIFITWIINRRRKNIKQNS